MILRKVLRDLIVHPRGARLFRMSQIHRQDQEQKHVPKMKPFPTLMKFPERVWPSVFLSAKNWFLVYLVIRPNLDADFDMKSFLDGARHALQAVSDALSKSDFPTLKNLVTDEAFDALKTSASELSVSEREQLSLDAEDVYFSFPYEIGIIENDNRRWVEITTVFHILRGLEKLRADGNEPPMNAGLMPEYQERLFICNYRFIREYTKGVTDEWVVNVVNHFRPNQVLK